ncbi:hypothetical protein U1769_16060 [Sphingomonas sp. ZT3P38]|uniref:hypothetical protein n=1 Tax=Parasphingomonas zepuensis TaxID=3096161 RepID=UPI002FCC38C3
MKTPINHHVFVLCSKTGPQSRDGTFEMHLMQLLRCATGNHARSGRHSRMVDGRWVSVCRGCGRAMIKDDFTWQLAGASGARLLPQEHSDN